MTDTSNPRPREKTKPNTDSLRNIALFLEGWKFAKGDISPLGTYDLTVLWESIEFIKKAEKQ